MDSPVYHIPALLQPTLEALDIKPDGTYIDATFGGAGHSRAILEHLGPKGRLFSFDQDIDARANAIDDPRFTFVHSNFRYITNFMRFYKVDKVDGILADLGVSFHHFDDAQRGFSFRADAPLDMRMNRSAQKNAAEILADASRDELTRIFATYGDLKRPTAFADAIIKARTAGPVDSTAKLTAIVEPLLNPRQEKKDLAKVFQALRIEVNGELNALERFLSDTPRILREGGRLAVITYHSLEDRMVKNFMKTGNIDGTQIKDFFGKIETPWKIITKTPIVPTEEEIERNPRSRSAKLRVAELI